MVGACRQADSLEVLGGGLVALLARDALVIERKSDVLERGLESEQVKRLEDETDETISVVRGIAFGKIANQSFAEMVRARIVGIQDPEDVEQRALARARRSHDAHELSLIDPKAHVAQDVELPGAAPVPLVDVLEPDHVG